MFKDVPDEVDEDKDPVDGTIGEMDRFGVDVGVLGPPRLTLQRTHRDPGALLPADDPKAYAVYAACVELDVPIVVNAGIAGPRFPSACQHVERFDQVCFDFPELRIGMRHGAEPWEELAVKLMLKWPGLYYMTAAYSPNY